MKVCVMLDCKWNLELDNSFSPGYELTRPSLMKQKEVNVKALAEIFHSQSKIPSWIRFQFTRQGAEHIMLTMPRALLIHINSSRFLLLQSGLLERSLLKHNEL